MPQWRSTHHFSGWSRLPHKNFRDPGKMQSKTASASKTKNASGRLPGQEAEMLAILLRKKNFVPFDRVVRNGQPA
jgi:hypothetical protein